MTAGGLTPASARAEFPATAEHLYLDVASRAPMADRVAAALQRYIATYQAEGVPKADWLAAVERIRGRVARLLGADAHEVAFTKSTSDGLNMVAAALGLRAGDNVVICPEIEHANNVYPWLHLRDRGVEVRLVDPLEGRFPVERAVACMDARTRVLSLSSVSFVTGGRADLAAVAERCHQRGVFLLVDAVQELGALRMDVHALGVDGLAAATQKMLLGMYGLGVLYCRRDRLEGLRPPFLTRMGVEWGEGHESDLDLDGYRLRPGAARFEVGNPNFAGLFALDAALSLLEDVGAERVEAHVLDLAGRLLDGVADLGLDVLTPREPGAHAGLVCFRPPDAEAVSAALVRAGVKVALRRGAVRASVHVFNDTGDVDGFLDVLAGACRPRARRR